MLSGDFFVSEKIRVKSEEFRKIFLASLGKFSINRVEEIFILLIPTLFAKVILFLVFCS